MRKSAFFFCSFVFVFGQLTSAAQSADSIKKPNVGEIAPIIISGLEAYKAKGPEEAVRAWIKGSPIDESKDALSQSNYLRQVQDYYGAYQTFDIVSTHDITSRVRMVYLVLNYEKGPLFVRFMVYRSDKTWILTNFKFNTQEDVILPAGQ